MKRAMPFMQSLKARLDGGENPERVFERQLPFDEAHVLSEMVLGLKAAVRKLEVVEIVRLKEDGTGVVVSTSGKTPAEGEQVTPSGIPGDITPGKPAFIFVNIEE